MVRLYTFVGAVQKLGDLLTERQAHAMLLYDCAPLHDPDELLEAWIKPFSLPVYYGRNWDALDECLSDLSWIRGDIFFVVKSSQHLRALSASRFRMVVEMLAALGTDDQDISADERLRDVCFHADHVEDFQGVPELTLAKRLG